MKKSCILPVSLLLVLTVALSGCDLVVGIFKAGVWAGVILVVVVIVLLVWLIRKVLR